MSCWLTMSVKMTIARKGLILISVPLILQFVFVCILSSLLRFSQEDAARLSQSRAFVTQVDILNRDFLELGLSLAAFRYTKGRKFIKQYDQIVGGLPAKFDELKRQSEGHPSRLTHVENLQRYGNKVIELTQSFRRPADSALVYLLDPLAYRQKISDAFSQFTDETSAIANEELKLQENSPAAESKMRKMLSVCIALGLLCSTLITFILTKFFMTNITGRLAVLTANSLNFSHKKPLMAPVLGNDEIAELDQDFRKMVSHIEDAESRRQLYVQMISHDLRGPLTAMRGTFEAASRGLYGEISDKGKNRFAAAQSDSDRLIGLINEMIDYDSLSSGGIELAKDSLQAEELMIAAKNSLESLAEGKHVSLEFTSDEVNFTGDGERLKRVLINLIHNAIKFSPVDSVVKTEAKVEKGFLVYRVFDHGPGIKQDEIASLFDPFHMGESSEKISDTGSGLGLAICKMIIEAHHGTLGVDSQLGQGSCFWFSLPLG